MIMGNKGQEKKGCRDGIKTKNFILDLRITIITFFITLIFSYIICIIAGILFDWTMYRAWEPLLPGFVWPVT